MHDKLGGCAQCENRSPLDFTIKMAFRLSSIAIPARHSPTRPWCEAPQVSPPG
jgi:hypothetical protein